jgi:DNA-binding CsgD family transcriptional regulator
MDHVESNRARENTQQQRIRSALRNGLIVVDVNGNVAWLDDTTRRRINGGLRELSLPIYRASDEAVDCFMSTLDVTINGERMRLCVVQEVAESSEPERDLIAAIHAVMADTSWFTRTVIEKVKALRQGAPAQNADDIGALSDREREVLGLICEGKSDADMSEILHLSPNTVRNHIMALYRKIGVNRRTAAIIWARERGITCLDAVAPTKRRASPTPHPDHSGK